MSIISGFTPKSLLAFIIGLSFVALYFSIVTGNIQLQDVSTLALWIFVPIFLIFLFLTIFRNVRSLR